MWRTVAVCQRRSGFASEKMGLPGVVMKQACYLGREMTLNESTCNLGSRWNLGDGRERCKVSTQVPSRYVLVECRMERKKH